MVEEKIETFLTQLKSLDALSLSLIEEIRALKEKNQTLENEIALFKEQSDISVSQEELQAIEKERDILKADNEKLSKELEALSHVEPESTQKPAKKVVAKKTDNATPSLF